MTADADTALRVQTPLPLPFATRVLKNLIATVGVEVSEDHIRNQLLERRILFHLRPGAIADVSGIEQMRQVPIGVGRKTLKVSERVKDRGRDNQYMFDLSISHGQVTPRKDQVQRTSLHG